MINFAPEGKMRLKKEEFQNFCKNRNKNKY